MPIDDVHHDAPLSQEAAPPALGEAAEEQVRARRRMWPRLLLAAGVAVLYLLPVPFYIYWFDCRHWSGNLAPLRQIWIDPFRTRLDWGDVFGVLLGVYCLGPVFAIAAYVRGGILSDRAHSPRPLLIGCGVGLLLLVVSAVDALLVLSLID